MRILALGDCNTTGSGALEKGRSFPQQLASILHTDNNNIDLINLGFTMSTTREGLARMRDQGMQMAADLVIINYGLVDAWVTTLPSIYVPYYPDSRTRKLRRKLLKFLKRRLRAPWLRRLVPVGEVVPPLEYRANLEAFIGMARAANSDVTIILWGSPETRNDPPRDQNLEKYNHIMQSVAEQHGCTYLDTMALLKQDTDRASLYMDDVHLSARGYDIIAHAIYSLYHPA